MSPEKVIELQYQFGIPGTLIGVKEIKTGHINTTYLVSIEGPEGEERFILQSISRYVFKEPERIMSNVAAVTDHIRRKSIEHGEDPTRATLTFLQALDGRNYHIDGENAFWRMYRFIDNSITYDTVPNLELLTKAGMAFGDFQRKLADFPIDALYHTIPDFHNTKKRLADFFDAVEEDPCGRVKDIRDDIEFFRIRRQDGDSLIDMGEKGLLPLRVTHNDTKYNNILIDIDTQEALCVIDLDTVMPGLSAYDFGDAIRFAASTSAEDETDLTKVSMNLEYYEAFTKGFIGAAKGFFTPLEIEAMAWGARIITLELASRFLLDHINGDKYFRVHHANHNLERARNQMRLVEDMEMKFDEMMAICRKYNELAMCG